MLRSFYQQMISVFLISHFLSDMFCLNYFCYYNMVHVIVFRFFIGLNKMGTTHYYKVETWTLELSSN